MPAQTAGNVGKNRVPVVEFDRERGAWEHLLDAAVHFERRLFVVDAVRLDFTRAWRSIPSSDNDPLSFLAAAATKRSTPRLWLGLKTIPGSGIAERVVDSLGALADRGFDLCE